MNGNRCLVLYSSERYQLALLVEVLKRSGDDAATNFRIKEVMVVVSNEGNTNLKERNSKDLVNSLH